MDLSKKEHIDKFFLGGWGAIPALVDLLFSFSIMAFNMMKFLIVKKCFARINVFKNLYILCVL